MIPTSKPVPPRPRRVPPSLEPVTATLASPGEKRTLWQSWLALKPSVRMTIGVGFAVFAVGGLYISDQLRARYPAAAKDDPQSKDAERRPSRFGIRVVDKAPASRTEAPSPSSSSSLAAAPSSA